MASVTAIQGNDRVGVHPGECVCWSVGGSTDVADICGELGHEIQVPGLSGRMTVVVGLEGEGEWPMIRHHEKVSALHEMPKCRMARYTAKSSLSNVLYLVSAGCSFLEK